MEVAKLQAALVQCREDLALIEALLLATDVQLAAARQAAAQVVPPRRGLPDEEQPLHVHVLIWGRACACMDCRHMMQHAQRTASSQQLEVYKMQQKIGEQMQIWQSWDMGSWPACSQQTQRGHWPQPVHTPAWRQLLGGLGASITCM